MSELLNGSVMLDEVRNSILVFLFRRDDEDVRTEIVLFPRPVAVSEDHHAVIVKVVLFDVFTDASGIRAATTRSVHLRDISLELERLEHLSVPESDVDLSLLVEVVKNLTASRDVLLAHRAARVDGEKHTSLAVVAIARKIVLALVPAETRIAALSGTDGSSEASDDSSDVDFSAVVYQYLFNSIAR